jgi:hypothetical protein
VLHINYDRSDLDKYSYIETRLLHSPITILCRGKFGVKVAGRYSYLSATLTEFLFSFRGFLRSLTAGVLIVT